MISIHKIALRYKVWTTNCFGQSLVCLRQSLRLATGLGIDPSAVVLTTSQTPLVKSFKSSINDQGSGGVG
jgi:hypothetical protein